MAKIVYKFTITSTHCLTAKIIVLQELSTIKIKAKVQVEAKLSSAIAFLYNKTPVKSINCSNNTLHVARNRHQRSKAQSTWLLIKTTSYNQVRLRARKLCKWLCQVTTIQHNSALKVILWQKWRVQISKICWIKSKMGHFIPIQYSQIFLVKTRSLLRRNLCITWWNILRLRSSLRAISNKQ